MSAPEWRVFPDMDALVAALADALLHEAEHALATRGAFDLVLAGGNTPRALYRALAESAAGNPHWQIWYGDERCLPAADRGRNNVMAETAWLAGSGIPADNWHTIPAELGADAATSAYADLLKGVGEFDLVLLGVGEDGHTSSLFPGADWGAAADSPDVLPIYGAPKPPPQRVSLSAARLSRSGKVWFLATGASKRAAVQQWRSGQPLPVSAITGRLETVAWLDADAASSVG
jgi:6-phosphogluconolactonase